jgi:hypothetical protein
LKDALRQFSDRQSRRTYSARSTNTLKESDERDEAVRKYRDFLRQNQKYFDRDEFDFETPSSPGIFIEPKPPSGKKPDSKKFSSVFLR